MAETFALSLQAFAKKAPEQARAVIRKVSIDILTATVMRTPVGNPDLWKSKPPAGYVGGRLRGNWNVSIAEADTSTTSAIDNAGGATVGRGASIIAGSNGEQDIYITNSLPYALPVEYGHSGAQAPAGMVRVTVTEFQAFVDKAAAEVGK